MATSKKVIKGIWSGISAILGFVLGTIAGWIYLGTLLLINVFKKRLKLSLYLQGVLKTYYPTINLDKVTIITKANGIPYGKIALTEGYKIFCRNDFSENKTEDLKLLLHELVHVKQYYDRGIGAFYIAYAYEYINEMFSYSNIPMEKEAVDYEGRICDVFLSDYKELSIPEYRKQTS